jgi:ABC-type antimicrobial peptide transport system permease subunit
MLTAVSGATWTMSLQAPAGVGLTGRERNVAVNAVSPGWFDTQGIAFVSGRDVADRDAAGAPRVVVINETAARRFFPAGNPVGRTLVEAGSGQASHEVIGVVKDAVYSSLREPATATMYEPLAQQVLQEPSINLSVRAANGSPALLTRPLADAIASVDPNLSITFRLLSDQVNATLTRERLLAMLSGFFGVLALALAALGLYGVMAFAVSRQRTEIGIRMALGAGPARVVRQILRRVALLLIAGSVAGVALSWWAGRFISTLLYGLEPNDPWTISAAVLVLACTGVLASALPAWHASRIEPTEVLRSR